MLRELYTISVNEEATRYVGLTIKWDWKQQTCTLSMPGYIKAILHKFNHPTPTKPQDSTHKCVGKYGDWQKLLPNPPAEKQITAEQNKRLEKLLGSLLFYGMEIDCTILTAIKSIAVAKKHGMKENIETMTQLLIMLPHIPTRQLRILKEKLYYIFIPTHPTYQRQKPKSDLGDTSSSTQTNK